MPEDEAPEPLHATGAPRKPGNCLGCGLLLFIAAALIAIASSALWKAPAGRLGQAGLASVPTGIERPAAVFLSGGLVRSGIYFGHTEHTEQDIHCEQCHDAEHHQKTPADVPKLCAECHAENQKEPEWCSRCHLQREGLRPADHTGGGWATGHGGAGVSYVAAHETSFSCQTCHPGENSCAACHRLEMPHPGGFATSHKSVAWAARGDCLNCHTEATCANCHHKQKPASHAKTPFVHWDAGLLSGSRCETCHSGSSYCNTCHQKQKPDSHTEGWDHGKAALAFDSRCLFCHQQSTCRECHGIEMPHSGGFVAAHWKQDTSQCARCHQDRTNCMACHQLVQPQSHRAADWGKTHGKTDAKASCANCHDEPVCMKCHGLEMPHPDDFGTEHGAPAYDTPATCAKCHQPAACLECHQEMKPSDHVEGFDAEHGPRAKDHEPYCYLCHSKAEYCDQCHGE
jgi:hypothetical protein